MTKIVCISDTHLRLKRINVPDGDILIHAGDLTSRGSEVEIEHEAKEIASLPHKYKIVIAGNHDFGFQHDAMLSRKMLEDLDIVYLEDEAATIEGIKFYGSPWQPWFFDWAFNLQRGEEIKQKWDMIPSDVEVLITHGPRKFVLDSVGPDKHNPVQVNVGCEELAKVIDSRLTKLKLHVFGHIHNQHGSQQVNGVTYINASCLDDRYQPVYRPIIFNL